MLQSILLKFLAISLLGLSYPGGAQKNPQVIEIHAHRYAFEPSSITVHRGEQVQLDLISDDVPHTLLIKSLGINEAASKSHPGSVIFTAAQPGDFDGRCGRFCGSGHGRMHFVVHVTD